ncbi:ecto-ADP-ribosyltransferase 3-like [Leptodactylus fuscus]|uniref:ecto-ADP-ribosyltransferase 3-like n=1 Tax=Leptodactylus fuscus TaxID=238119 RepID=UPI003F4ECBB9
MAGSRLLIFCLGLCLVTFVQVFCVAQYKMDMSEDIFDDQYVGCTDQMEAIAPEILKKERMARFDVDVAWNMGTELWQKRKPFLGRLPDGFTDEHGIAILIYTSPDIPLSQYLYHDIKNYVHDPKSFSFHALHFYLTRALTLLQPGCDGKPKSVYWPLRNIQIGPPSQETVRFTYITIATSILWKTRNRTALFHIDTCFGVELLNFSHDPSYKEVLIPMNEVFQVTSYNTEENKITLQSTNRMCSYYNCAYLGGEKRENCTTVPLLSDSAIMKFRKAVTVPLLVAMSIAVMSTLQFPKI